MKRTLFLLLLIFALMTINSQAATYYVDDDGSNTLGNGTNSNPWKTITYALTKVADGDIVSVKPGKYDSATGEIFPIVITKNNLTIASTNGPLVTIINGSDTSSTTPIIDVEWYKGFMLSGFTITGGIGDGVRIWGSDNAYIGNNIFLNIRWTTLDVQNSPSAKIVNNLFSENTQIGLFMFYINDSVISGNIFDSRIKSDYNYYRSIWAERCNRASIFNNTFYERTAVASIWIEDGYANRIEHNLINRTYNGIVLQGTSGSIVTDNLIQDTRGMSIFLYLQNSAVDILRNNIFNSTYGISIGFQTVTDDIKIENNNLFDIQNEYLTNLETSEIKAAHNYWWTTNITQIQNRIYGNVTFTEFLCEPYPTAWYSTNGICSPDSDNDGVLDGKDLCPGTSIPEKNVPKTSLGTNRLALTNSSNRDGNYIKFSTTAPKGSKNVVSISSKDTKGCSCEQILMTQKGNMEGHWKFGCSEAIIKEWISKNK